MLQIRPESKSFTFGAMFNSARQRVTLLHPFVVCQSCPHSTASTARFVSHSGVVSVHGASGVGIVPRRSFRQGKRRREAGTGKGGGGKGGGGRGGGG